LIVLRRQIHFDRDQTTGGDRLVDREQLFGRLCHNVLVPHRFGWSAGDGIYATGRNLEGIRVKNVRNVIMSSR
jgi:hypothetical protein